MTNPEDKHQRISQAQFEIWLENPVTLVYLQCLEWSAEQITEILGNGGYVDSNNNDRSMNMLHSATGEQGGLKKAGIPRGIMDAHRMLEEEKAEEKAKDVETND